MTISWQWKLYRRHTQKVLFLLDAIENNDASIHFSEHEDIPDNHIVNQALNRVASILYNVKSETAQQEKYYELMMSVRTSQNVQLLICRKPPAFLTNRL